MRKQNKAILCVQPAGEPPFAWPDKLVTLLIDRALIGTRQGKRIYAYAVGGSTIGVVRDRTTQFPLDWNIARQLMADWKELRNGRRKHRKGASKNSEKWSFLLGIEKCDPVHVTPWTRKITAYDHSFLRRELYQ